MIHSCFGTGAIHSKTSAATGSAIPSASDTEFGTPSILVRTNGTQRASRRVLPTNVVYKQRPAIGPISRNHATFRGSRRPRRIGAFLAIKGPFDTGIWPILTLGGAHEQPVYP